MARNTGQLGSMAKRRSSRTSSPLAAQDAAVRSAASVAPVAKPNESAVLAVLVYLCGDNHVEKYTDDDLKRMLGFGESRHLHLAVQYDSAAGARRYVVRAGDSITREEKSVRRDVNTGDAAALQEFLDGGLAEVTAEHYVLILSGLGINPRYVRQSLPLEALPEPLQDIRGGKPGDPNDQAYVQQFAKGVESLSSANRPKYLIAVHQRLFSVCHDFSNSGSLGISDLR